MGGQGLGGDVRPAAQLAKIKEMRKIGILYGMESTFPPALIERINAFNIADVRAESIVVGGVGMAQPSGYRVIVDRI